VSASWWSPTIGRTTQTRGPATEKPFATRKLDYFRARGRAHPPFRQRGGGDINAQLAQAREPEAKLAEEYRTVRLLRTPLPEKPPRAANARVS
jgi:hypothetical protein